jgi:prephenate dehydratase
MKIGFAGQRGAYSEAAAAALFQFDIATHPLHSIDAVFDAIATGEVSAGVAPVEKTPSGYIAETFALLRTSRLYITHSIIIRTAYVLAGNKGASLDSVRRIYAHPHGMTACEGFLRGLEGVELIPRFEFDHVETSIMKRGSPEDAVLCSTFVAARRGHTVLKDNCNNQHDAFTRYIVMAKEPRIPAHGEGQAVTTVLFEVEDRPGALMRKLAVIAELGLNIVRLKMFPASSEGGLYTAFITFAGRYTDSSAGRALEVIQATATNARHLGSYVVKDAR